MRTYRCTVRCQWRLQLWKIGETVECGGGEVPPSAFFEPLGPDPETVTGPSEESDDVTTKPRRARKKKEYDDDGPGGGEPGADTAGG